MTTPRHLLIAPDAPGFYHLISRCVRRSWLCGRQAGRDYSYRKQWIAARLRLLGSVFALEVHAYAIMSNHFHLVIYSDPCAPRAWTDEEVIDRWLTVCPPLKRDGTFDAVRAEQRRQNWLGNSDYIARLRKNLGSVSVFMKLLKQPIARRANQEDGCTGHFFEQRFYSGALLDDQAVQACMAYVDLNPVRAKITHALEQCIDASIGHRLSQTKSSIDEYLKPVVSGLSEPTEIPMTFRAYITLLRSVIDVSPSQENIKTHRATTWRQRLQVIARRQRAYGRSEVLLCWLSERGLSHRETHLA